ncbi:MAG: uroporphyrinogen-III C-methyltransferase-like [Caulobacteraceae bacterium]|nr:uroporphyrinogen-III C-methyltransferase-like [Caulobacteraceae bacterium]
MSKTESHRRFAALARSSGRAGEVWLVGAGPGDPELLTVKALKALQAADVVVHDRLTPPAILELAGPEARLIDVGKRKSRHTLPQEGINQLLVALALAGHRVVRLKGGDPFVFGRGGEELAELREAGIVTHVVPGVTAAFAAAASAGAPLTHRGLAQAVTFVTGHAAKGEAPNLDWAALGRGNETVVVYMGVSTAPLIAARLIEAGRAGSTPVLVVENASLQDERRIVTTLAGLGAAVEGLEGPAILIVGEVAALATSLSPDVGELDLAPGDGRDERRFK